MRSFVFICVVLTFAALTNAFDITCTDPSMTTYQETVSFVCTFSQKVEIKYPDRILVPDFVSITPSSGFSTTYTIKSRVVQKSAGVISLILAPLAFRSEANESNEKYTRSVVYDFTDPIQVTAQVMVSLSRPDRTQIVIRGGKTVRTASTGVSSVVEFPDFIIPLSMHVTENEYIVDAFVTDPSKFSTSTFKVLPASFYTNWGRQNNTLPLTGSFYTIPGSLRLEETVDFWPEGRTNYFVTSESVNITVTTECGLDASSFVSSNLNLEQIEKGIEENTYHLIGKVVDMTSPAQIIFVSYVPLTCSLATYPEYYTLTLIQSKAADYEIDHSLSTTGCSFVSISFDAPVKITTPNVLEVTTDLADDQFIITARTHLLVPGSSDLYTQLNYEVCVLQDGIYSLNIREGAVISSGNDPIVPKDDAKQEVFISKQELVLSEEVSEFKTYKNSPYVIRTKDFKLIFTPLSTDIDLGYCSFDKAFTSDADVVLQALVWNGKVELSVSSLTVQEHEIMYHPSEVECNGSIHVKFLHASFKYAYDPPFVPGDIVVTRINSYYQPEIDFVPLRTVYTWNKIFFTDAGWLNHGYCADNVLCSGFVDHGTDGYMSWQPKTTVQAGDLQKWSHLEMNGHLNDREIPEESIDYAFSYVMHGFMIDLQDNLFIYVTDQHDEDSLYDSSDITFVFGVYWSSSEWMDAATYLEITSETSELPDQLIHYSIALGLAAYPLPRGVNYMSIKKDEWQFSFTYFHVIEKIINRDYWATSLVNRFTEDAPIQLIANPMRYTIHTTEANSTITTCFTFSIGYTKELHSSLLTVMFDDEIIEYTQIVEESKICIEYENPLKEGYIIIEGLPGAFTYTTTTTITPVTFNSTHILYQYLVESMPVLSVIYDSTKRVQMVTVESNRPCVSYGTYSVTKEGSMDIVSRSSTKTTFALTVKETGTIFTLDEGYCVTKNGAKSDEFISDDFTITGSSIVPGATGSVVSLAFNGAATRMRTNTVGNKQFVFTIPEGYSSAIISGMTVPVYVDDVLTTAIVTTMANTVTLTIAFESEVVGVHKVSMIRSFYQKDGFSLTGLEFSFEFMYVEYDVLDSIEFPWDSTTLTKEGVYAMPFSFSFYPTYRTKRPNEIITFSDGCYAVGYSLSATTTNVFLAVLDGECKYEVYSGSVYDTYGNTNKVNGGSVSFDFLPPFATIEFIPKENEITPPVAGFWNSNPDLLVHFNEEIIEPSDPESLIVISGTGCQLSFLSMTVVDGKSTLGYRLDGCADGTVSFTLTPNVVISDTAGNSIKSQDSIVGFPTSIVIDTVRPTITLSNTDSLIRTQTVDVEYVISEPNTLFTCQSIAVVLTNTQFTVTNVDNHICRYTFIQLPVNGTHIYFSVPAGRFTDRAGNPNVASNTLSRLIFNTGAVIMVDAPRYTDQSSVTFTVMTNYTWLCPNYEYVFPSTFEYDRSVALIEAVSDPIVDEDTGSITQTFTLSFHNADIYPEYRFKDLPIYIPSYVCNHHLDFHNNPVTFYVTYDSSPPVPTIEMVSGDIYVITATFEESKEFGFRPANEFMHITYEDESLPLSADACVYSRTKFVDQFTYRAECDLTIAGNIVVTIEEGAVIDLIDRTSKFFTKTLYADGNPPVVSLAAVSGNTIGAGIMSIDVRMSISKLVQNFTTEGCIEVKTDANGPTLPLVITPVTTTLYSSTQVLRVRFTSAMNAPNAMGAFGLIVREKCMYDEYNNYNLESNMLAIRYDFSQPIVTLTSDFAIVYRSAVIRGTVTKPIQVITSDNIQLPTSCSLEKAPTVSGTSFTFTVNCENSGTMVFKTFGIKDIYGNAAGLSNELSIEFTVTGPVIHSTIQNLINEEYVNTQSFTVIIEAKPSCASMSFGKTDSIIVDNASITMKKLGQCRYEIVGQATKVGVVTLRLSEGIAVDSNGSPSQSEIILFKYRNEVPALITIEPTLLAGGQPNTIRICYDWNIHTYDTSKVVVSSGCSNAVVAPFSNNCMDITVDVIVPSAPNQRCLMNLLKGFVQPKWMVESAVRYLAFDVDPQFSTIQLFISSLTRRLQEVVAFEEPTTTDFYVSANSKLVVSINDKMTVDDSKRTVEMGCTTSTISWESNQPTLNDMTASIVFTQPTKCDITVSFAQGYFTDKYGRYSAAQSVVIHYDPSAFTGEVVSERYQSSNPVEVKFQFTKNVKLELSNLQFVPELSDEVSVEIIEEEGETIVRSVKITMSGEVVEYAIQLIDVKDIYGMSLENINDLATTVSLCEGSPAINSELVDSVMTNSAVTRDASYIFIFDREVKFVNPITTPFTQFTVTCENYECGSGEDTPYAFLFHSVAIEGKMLTIVGKPTATENKLYTTSIVIPKDLIQDMAGNALSNDISFDMIVDNAKPVVEYIEVNGDSIFNKFPMTVKVMMSKDITLSESFSENMIVTSTPAVTCVLVADSPTSHYMFMMECTKGEGEFNENDTIAFEFKEGFGTDAQSLSVVESTHTLTCAASTLTLDSESHEVITNAPQVTLTFNKKITSVDTELITLSGEGSVMGFANGKNAFIEIIPTAEGDIEVTIPVGSIIASDGTTTSESLTYSFTFDNTKPTIMCEQHEPVSFGPVTIFCSAFEPLVYVPDTLLFNVMMNDETLTHTETYNGGSSDDITTISSVTLEFTPKEAFEAGFYGQVIITPNESVCKDAASNTCMALEQTVTVDMTPVEITFSPSSVFMKDGDNIDIIIGFTKEVHNFTDSYIQVELPEVGGVTYEFGDMRELHAGMVFMITLSVHISEPLDSIVPFMIMIGENVVVDGANNPNLEGNLVLYINEVKPVMTHSLLEVEGAADNEIAMEFSFTNGPVLTFDIDMISFSDNIFNPTIQVLPTEDETLLNKYKLSFKVMCTSTCSYELTILAELVVDAAGNQMAEDYKVEGKASFKPRVTLSHTTQSLCGSTSCSLTIAVSEPIATIDCAKLSIVVPTAGFTIVPHTCSDATSCECSFTAGETDSVTAARQVCIQMPANALVSVDEAKSLASNQLCAWQSTQPLSVLLTSTWTPADSVLEIPMTATVTSPFTSLSSSIIECVNCMVTGWNGVETNSIMTYTMKVSFINDSDKYAKVVVPENAFTDSFGLSNVGSEFVIRIDQDLTMMTDLKYTANSATPLTLFFNSTVHACGGSIILTPVSYPSLKTTISTSNSKIVYSNSMIKITTPLISKVNYVVSWTDDAFCDTAQLPISNLCSKCTFTTATGPSSPPASVTFGSITQESAKLTYSDIWNGGSTVTQILVYSSPAIPNVSTPMVVEVKGAAGTSGVISLTGLESGMMYSIVVQTRNAFGTGVPSQPYTFTTLAGTPEPAANVRVCEVIDPTTTEAGHITYTVAKLCWTPSVTMNTNTQLVMNEVVWCEGENDSINSCVIEIESGTESFEVSLITTTSSAVPSGVSSESVVTKVFSGIIDLEDVAKYGQGEGMSIHLQHMAKGKTIVVIEQPLENYFKVEKYLVHYANVFDDIFDSTGSLTETYTFRNDKCKGEYVELSVRVIVHGTFNGVYSNVIKVPCKVEAPSIEVIPYYSFATYQIKGVYDMHLVCATTELDNPSKTVVVQTIDFVPNTIPEPVYLINNLMSDKSYIVTCNGIDKLYEPLTVYSVFTTTSTYVAPSMRLDTETEVVSGSYFANVKVAFVSVPGTVYCLARPNEVDFNAVTRSTYLNAGFYKYVYPDTHDPFVTIQGLTPSTEYVAKCIFEAEKEPNTKLLSYRRRLVDDLVTFTTADVYVPTIVSIMPTGQVNVPLNTDIVITTQMPVTAYGGDLIIKCVMDELLTQVIAVNSDRVSIEGNKITIRLLRSLTIGMEYAVITSGSGVFIDSVNGYALPKISMSDNYVFTTMSDVVLSAAPVLISSNPMNNGIKDLVDMKVYLTFDKTVKLSESASYIMQIGDDIVRSIELSTSDNAQVRNNMVAINTKIFFPSKTRIHFVFNADSFCSVYGSCNTESFELTFTTGLSAYAPSLLSVSPAHGSVNVPAGTDVVFTFNKLMKIRDSAKIKIVNEIGTETEWVRSSDKLKVRPKVTVHDNVIRMSGSLFASGHTYVLTLAGTEFTDLSGLTATQVPSMIKLQYSSYSCSGNYISQQMSDDCSCFLTYTKCECWCGKVTPSDVVVRLLI